jgi:DNA-binding NarL/FixJ family response regulator
MIVDDQEDVRLLLRVLIDMANEGLFVRGEACGGAEALARLDEDDPIVIVLDQMMPDMNGLETAVQIRRRRPEQIIILCSAYLDRDVIEQATAAGVQFCVGKEEVRQLPDIIRAAVGQH